MLSRSFISSATAEALEAKAHKPAHIIERSAAYSHSSTLGWVHYHKEMNYRKEPLGWKAYSKKNCDIFAPFAQGRPFRHVETKFPGQWFGAGHWVPSKSIGFGRKYALIWVGGTGTAFITLYRRLWMNGFEVMNKGAVSGME